MPDSQKRGIKRAYTRSPPKAFCTESRQLARSRHLCIGQLMYFQQLTIGAGIAL